MTERILLVDYENIQAMDLAQLPPDIKVRLVLGGKRGNLPTALKATRRPKTHVETRCQTLRKRGSSMSGLFPGTRRVVVSGNLRCAGSRLARKESRGGRVQLHHTYG